MVDYLSVETGGWFHTDGLVPAFQEVFTGGWFNTYDPTWSPDVMSGVIDLAVMYQMGAQMGMRG